MSKLPEREWRCRYEAYNERFKSWDTITTPNNPETFTRAFAASLHEFADARNIRVESRDDDGWTEA